ncbi:MAG TPA: proline--tRNA ligase [Candidatus Omnitrophota bacterium]|nr:proline--tRNA ligase [Candidatus Omnitrophota bacterium]
MRWTQTLIPTLKEVPVGTEAVSHQLLLRAGLVNMLTSGVYSYLPLGLKVLRRIETIIREEMNAAGARELFLPCLQPIELWKQTGRDQVLQEIMIRFKDNRGREMCLGPTHEEVITALAKNYVQSYRQLPLTLYQIQTKFRDELRTRFGIVRACEFIMKDAYSFDRDVEGLERVYQKMYNAYQNVFKRCGVDVHIIAADSGAMGGDVSHEFLALAPIGEDEVALCGGCGFAGAGALWAEGGGSCPSCGKALTKQVAIELGHIFQLGTKYSQAQGAMFLDEDGKLKPMIMGCYGIGVSRLIAAVVEKNYDDNGIVWPREVAPYDVEILPLTGEDAEGRALAREYAETLEKCRFEVLVDDREESPGRKFHDADLIGIPYRLILGARGLKEGLVEIKERRSGRVLKIRKEDIMLRLPGILRDGFPEKDEDAGRC